jgi:hypothetical protein
VAKASTIVTVVGVFVLKSLPMETWIKTDVLY